MITYNPIGVRTYNELTRSFKTYMRASCNSEVLMTSATGDSGVLRESWLINIDTSGIWLTVN